MPRIIDGKKISEELLHDMKLEIEKIQGRRPCLSVVLVGDHPPSKIYVNRKIKACEQVGIISRKIELPNSTSEKELLEVVNELNHSHEVDGILVQLPLPQQINPNVITLAIDPNKDVDGFHPISLGKLLLGEKGSFTPCTPAGIYYLLKKCNISTEGKHVVIVGRSNIVGKPTAALLMQRGDPGNATVTITHRFSSNLKQTTQLADILIVAVGIPGFIKADMVKQNAVVIDVGINKVNNKIVGDVDFEGVSKICGSITPVPGGVGPMTIAMLLRNTLISYYRREGMLV